MASKSRSVAVVLAFLSISFVVIAAQAAQVEVRQGDAGEERPNDFTSPMVLELPLPDLSAMSDGAIQQYQDEIRDYFCDDVALRHIQIERRKTTGPEASAQVTFRIRGTLFVRSSHDREVTLEVSIEKDGEPLIETEIREIEAEEKKSKAFKRQFVVPQSRLGTAFSSDPAPVLKITMWVRDDG